ncbi:MAG TPA: response regulator transcription factor [Acidimicrobiales bacterium]|nr:response regulator transcription factor [Acidimicrobiales bacterium]
MGNRVRIMCVGGCRAVRDMLALAIELEQGLELSGAAPDLDSSGDALEDAPSDVVVVLHDRSDAGGLEGVRGLKRRWPGLRVLVLARHPTIELLLRAAAADADGFLTNDSTLSEIIAALRNPTTGIELDEATMSALRQEIAGQGSLSGRQWRHGLTVRERDVLALLARGMETHAIARQLRISVHTARGYVRNVLGKLGAHSQLEAVLIALRSGIVRWDVVEQGPAAGPERQREPA